jgi:hypothetical protein
LSTSPAQQKLLFSQFFFLSLVLIVMSYWEFGKVASVVCRLKPFEGFDVFCGTLGQHGNLKTTSKIELRIT